MAKAKKTAPAASKIESREITSEAEWFAWRKQDVTASASPALLGIHNYQTAYGLYLEKRGEAPDIEESPPMKRGRLLEPIARKLLRENHPEIKWWTPNIYLRDPVARIGATPDEFGTTPDGAVLVTQIKSVAEFVFRAQWKGQIEGDRDAIEPPLWIVVQAVQEAHLYEQWLRSIGDNTPVRAAVAPLVVGFGIECPLIEIPLDNNAPRVLANIKKATLDFWKCVGTGVPPEFDYAKDGERIAALYGVTTGETIDLSRDNRIFEVHDALIAARADKKDATAREDAAKNEILAKMGPAEVAYLGEGRQLSAKQQSRAEHFVKASTFRVIRASKK